MKAKVVLTKKYQQEAIRQLQEKYNLVIVEDLDKSLVDVLRDNPDTQAIISFLSDSITKEIFSLVPQLKIVANYAVGYNNVDVEEARSRGIYVTNTPDILTNATADLAMGLIIAVARRIKEADDFLREGKWQGWKANLLLGKELSGCTLGIVGLGRIGTATALRAKSFGMKVVYYSRTIKPKLEKKHHFTFLPFIKLLEESDVVSIHLPSSAENHHMFNRDIFDHMKSDAIFINVSRGDLVDEYSLAEKLENEELFGAGLDVYEFEPQVTEKLLYLKNVILLPHLGSATYKTRLGMAQITVDSVKLALGGRKPKHLV